MDSAESCRDAAERDCRRKPKKADLVAQVEAWMETEFDVRVWRSRLLEVGDAGVCRVLQWCSRYCGRIAKNSFLPVVFRKFTVLQEEIGVSADGFYGPVKRAEREGLCLRVKVHGRPGRRQLLVLKFPKESALRAVACAKGAAERWEQLENGYSVEWVVNALEIELRQRVEQVTGERSADGGRKDRRNEACRDADGSLNCRERTSVCQRTDLCEAENRPISNKDREDDSGEQEVGEAERTRTSHRPSNVDSLSPFGNWLRDLLEEFGEEVGDIVLSQVDTTFDEQEVSGKRLRRFVTAKVVRLQAEGYGGEKILSFLLEDVDELAAQSRSSGRNGATGREQRGAKAEQPGEPEEPAEVTGNETASIEGDRVDYWPAVLDRLEEKMRADTFEYFISELVAIRDGEAISVTAKDSFTVEWVFEQWGDLVEAAVEEVAGEDVQIEWGRVCA